MPRWSSITWPPDEAVRLLREMARVARLGVVVNDLDRSRLGWVGAWLLGHLLTGNRYTRHDAPLSVRRAYRADEMAATAPRRRPDPGPDDPRLVRPALRDRGAVDARRGRRSVRTLAARPAGAGRMTGTGRRRDRRRRAGGGGPRGPARRGREPVVVLERSPAWHWRAGGVFASPAAVAALGGPASTPAMLADGRPADPGDARRDARRDRVPPDLRHRDRRRPGGRVRPVATRPGAARPRRVTRARTSGAAGRSTGGRPRGRPLAGPTTRTARDPPRGVASSSAPTVRTRSSRGPPGSPGRPASPADRADLPPAPTRTRTAAVTPGCGSCATATSGSRRSPAAGSTSASCSAGRGAGGWRRDGARAVAAGIVAAIPPTDDDPAAWRGEPPTDEVAGAWPLGHRVTRRAGPRLAARRRRGRVPRSVHRRGAPPGARLGRARRGRDRGARPRAARRVRRLRARDAAPVPGQGRRLVARPGLPRPARRCSSTRARRVAARPAVRATMGLVMGDLVPAGRALDPRYLAVARSLP